MPQNTAPHIIISLLVSLDGRLVYVTSDELRQKHPGIEFGMVREQQAIFGTGASFLPTLLLLNPTSASLPIFSFDGPQVAVFYPTVLSNKYEPGVRFAEIADVESTRRWIEVRSDWASYCDSPGAS